MVSVISSPLAVPVLGPVRLRGGSAGSARGAAGLAAEAIGTGPLFGLGRRAGVHPMLRAVPPRSALGRYSPDRLLVGHGPALDADAAPALSQALASSRTDLPKLLTALPSVIRGR